MAKRVQSPQDLKALREKVVSEIDLRDGQKDVRITVHMGTCGIAAGAREVLMEILSELSDPAATNVSIHQSGCAGLCDQEPMITVEGKGGDLFRYGKLDKEKVRHIIRQHVLRGAPVTEYLLNTPQEGR